MSLSNRFKYLWSLGATLLSCRLTGETQASRWSTCTRTKSHRSSKLVAHLDVCVRACVCDVSLKAERACMICVRACVCDVSLKAERACIICVRACVCDVSLKAERACIICK